MEVAGTVIGVLGLAGLFNTCIQTLDSLSAAARYGIDREILQTQIEVERVRLMIWGDVAGLAQILLDPSKQEATEDDLAALDESLQRAPLRAAVAGLLSCFARTLEDVEVLRKRYGLVPQAESKGKGTATSTVADKPAREILLATFRKTYSSFKDRQTSSQTLASPLTKARWAVADEPKFRELIAELKAVNDSLTSLLPAVRNKTRVKMRAEIMTSNNAGQLHKLISAVDDASDLISETASLRLEMLSTKGQGIPKKPAPRVVQVAAAATPPSTPAARQLALAPEPAAPLASPPPSSVPSTTRPSQADAERGSAPEPSFTPYGNAGSLLIHKVCNGPDRLSYYSWLSGIGEAQELEPVQPVFHPAFALCFIPDSILPVAKNILDVEMEADPKYAGWSPGSTSLTGFGREVTFWRLVERQTERVQPTWRRASAVPPFDLELILKRWKAIAQDGLGKDWTEKKGYEEVRWLVGPSEYNWLDPEEGFKIRHQISDLLALMSCSPVPSLQSTNSISFFFHPFHETDNWGFAHAAMQMLLAREATLRIERHKRKWYGGITDRIIYDMIAAELWSKSIEFTKEDDDEVEMMANKKTREQQLDGIVKFAEEMQWPYLDEIRDTVPKLLRQVEQKEDEGVQLNTLSMDWMSGLILPGSLFSAAILGALCSLSPTLRTRQPTVEVKARLGNHGIVYPQASYWSVRSVLGKVLAPLSSASGSRVKCLGGYVGPCLPPSPALPESTFGLPVELKARPPMFVGKEEPGLDPDDAMARTIVSGAESKQANAVDWVEPVPPRPSTNPVELQTLRLAKASPATEISAGTAMVGVQKNAPYTARLDFRLPRSKTMVTMTLRSNSLFVAAPPCRGSTHRIDPREADKYVFRVLEVEDLPLAELDARTMGDAAVAVINATSGGAAHTFARAWCCHRARNATIWKQGGQSCFKCALMTAGKNGLATGVLIVC